jgi:hypothetical protein
VLPVIREIQHSGATTFRAIASALNARGIPTARCGQWHDSTVRKGSPHDLFKIVGVTATHANSGAKATQRETRPRAIPATVR